MPGGGSIRVLVDNGEYALRNRGDLAMMAITVRRLREHWPDARIGMLTDQPMVLRALLPEAEPVHAATGGHWARSGFTSRINPGPVALHWRAASDAPKERLRQIRTAARATLHRAGRDTAAVLEPAPLPAALTDASLVIAQGGGYLTDVDRYQAHRVLDLLEQAAALGIPTAMIGQGIGPMRDPHLLRRAGAVLPGVDVIALREGRRGPDLLAELGVAPGRILVTGDDAVEFGYALRRAELGTDLGVCLRVADYSRVTPHARSVLAAVLSACATEFGAALAPLIVSEYDSEDRRATLPLLIGARRVRPAVRRSGTATDVAHQVADCRVLVTSTYHLAVFALSQGIPAVALSASRYYDDKFHGLAGMFGTGLRIIRLDDDALEQRLTDAVRELWTTAPALRDRLQDRATEQIAAGRTAMARVFGLVDESPHRRAPASRGSAH
ncbi:polysaccharide pyruvyl transferase family protein [Nocardia brasiliensis]|uniref:Polysaccharide pyruvyl transferase family protein n=1 Tax=Nocardia brasiliensis TaxID=37326 RepID=A0A6G9XQX9_NOCBR|nr:polysaccharide pyruvyl transferase family protein [Nocardia brasiliensis]QIS03233.1 polysaccharide pyruvyl transferase family protein [Nocardia brasiliensis]